MRLWVVMLVVGCAGTNTSRSSPPAPNQPASTADEDADETVARPSEFTMLRQHCAEGEEDACRDYWELHRNESLIVYAEPPSVPRAETEQPLIALAQSSTATLPGIPAISADRYARLAWKEADEEAWSVDVEIVALQGGELLETLPLVRVMDTYHYVQGSELSDEEHERETTDRIQEALETVRERTHGFREMMSLVPSPHASTGLFFDGDKVIVRAIGPGQVLWTGDPFDVSVINEHEVPEDCRHREVGRVAGWLDEESDQLLLRVVFFTGPDACRSPVGWRVVQLENE